MFFGIAVAKEDLVPNVPVSICEITLIERCSTHEKNTPNDGDCAEKIEHPWPREVSQENAGDEIAKNGTKLELTESYYYYYYELLLDTIFKNA